MDSWNTIQLYCRCCHIKGVKKYFKGKSLLDKRRNKNGYRISCQGLTSHLTRGSNHTVCKEHYVNEGLLIHDNRFDFSTSIFIGGYKKRKVVHSLSQLGMTRMDTDTNNTSDSAQNRVLSNKQESVNINDQLNNQVMHMSYRPPFDLTAVQRHVDQQFTNINMESFSSDNSNRLDSDDFDSTSDSGDSEQEDGDNEKKIAAVNKETMNTPDNDSNHGRNDYDIIQKQGKLDNVLNSATKIQPSLAVEMQLLTIMKKRKMPMNCFPIIIEWAKKSNERKGFNFSNYNPRSRDTIMKDLHQCAGNTMIGDKFYPTIINWLPDNKPTQIYVRSFLNALFSLLSNKELTREENLSFPDYKDPFSWKQNPSLTGDSVISELHHGSWWTKSWKSQCPDKTSRTILVPILLYIDGISLDTNNRLTLTPLNMSLGCYNIETRKSANAWECIYFHPDSSVEALDQVGKASPVDNVTNLHTGIAAALRSFKEACRVTDGIEYSSIPYGGQVHKDVKLKFAISYVIGDSDAHDKLCCHYTSRTGVSKLCRHCDCPTEYCQTT